MLRNGKLYGSIIPPDVNSLRIRDVSLGEKITLQLIALTEHPVGKGDYRTASGSVIGDKDSGISGSITQPDERPTGMFYFMCASASGCMHTCVLSFVYVCVPCVCRYFSYVYIQLPSQCSLYFSHSAAFTDRINFNVLFINIVCHFYIV